MKRTVALFTLATLAITATSAATSVAASQEEIAAARRQLETAQLRLRLYERDDHPRALHRLEREIELAQAHVESYQRRVKEYEQFEKLQYSSALFLTLEQTRLALRQAELKLEELQEERFLLLRHHSTRRRLFALEVESATARLASLGKPD